MRCDAMLSSKLYSKKWNTICVNFEKNFPKIYNIFRQVSPGPWDIFTFWHLWYKWTLNLYMFFVQLPVCVPVYHRHSSIQVYANCNALVQWFLWHSQHVEIMCRHFNKLPRACPESHFPKQLSSKFSFFLLLLFFKSFNSTVFFPYVLFLWNLIKSNCFWSSGSFIGSISHINICHNT